MRELQFLWRIFFSFIFIFNVNSIAVAATTDTLKISPQFVVQRVLADGRDAKNLEFEEKKLLFPLSQVLAMYDWQFAGKVRYEMDRAQVISGNGNSQDKTTLWNASLNKKIPTGTTFSLGYTRNLQSSIYRANSTNTRSPYIVLDQADFSVSQDLLSNFFGIVDRRAEKVARQNIYKAALEKRESQESLVLSALQLFWDTYVAKETLRENINARNKYESVVKELEQKTRHGFSNPGDMAKARAEFETQKINVKNAAFSYVNFMDKLLTMMLLPLDQQVEFDVPVEVPDLPPLDAKEMANLRKIQAAELTAENAAIEKKAADYGALPEIKLIGSLGYTGLEPQSSQAFAGLTSGTHPIYAIELNVNYRFFSEKVSGEKQQATVLYDQAFNNLLKAKEDEKVNMTGAIEKLQASYAVAKSSILSVKFWEQAIQEQEKSYRQGRLELSQLFQDYSSYFRAQSSRTKAIGDYHIALNQFAATKDMLVQ